MGFYVQRSVGGNTPTACLLSDGMRLDNKGSNLLPHTSTPEELAAGIRCHCVIVERADPTPDPVAPERCQVFWHDELEEYVATEHEYTADELQFMLSKIATATKKHNIKRFTQPKNRSAKEQRDIELAPKFAAMKEKLRAAGKSCFKSDVMYALEREEKIAKLLVDGVELDEDEHGNYLLPGE